MAKQISHIDETCRAFIARQKIFFAASAAPGAHINLSPRGTDAFAVIDDLTVAYLDRTGSGNETAAHLKADGRLTLMFCAFDGPPNILRLYGRGEVLRRRSDLPEPSWKARSPAWNRPARARLFSLMSIAFRRPADMERLCSSIAASARPWTIGPVSRAKTGLRPTGARRTPSASTACRPDCSRKPDEIALRGETPHPAP